MIKVFGMQKRGCEGMQKEKKTETLVEKENEQNQLPPPINENEEKGKDE